MFSILSSEMVLEKPWLLGISNKSCFQIATRELIMVSFLIFAILSIFCNPFFFLFFFFFFDSKEHLTLQQFNFHCTALKNFSIVL